MNNSAIIVGICQEVFNNRTLMQIEHLCIICESENVFEAAYFSQCHHKYGMPKLSLQIAAYVVISTGSAAREARIQTMAGASY